MAIYDDEILLGGEKLFIIKVSPKRVPKTIKQVIGSNLVEVDVLGVKSKQWVLDLTGVIIADSVANLETRRAALEALDNTSPHTLVDGHHDGSYYIEPGSLDFTDVGDEVQSIYRYTVKLVEQ
jgi:hypothetical protein